MLKQIYEIDDDGFIVEIFVGEFDDEGNLISPLGEFITTDLPQPLLFYKPKWTGTEWIEGATQEEIDEITKPKPNLPSIEERIESLENTILFLLGGM
nr:hypothetical protein [Heyndrickxia oleronia]